MIIVRSIFYCLGLIALLEFMLIRVASAFAISSLLTNLAYNKPFFLTYLSCATHSFYLAFYAVRSQWEKYRISSHPRTLTHLKGNSSQNYGSIERTQGDGRVQDPGALASSQNNLLSGKQIVKPSLPFCILWFLGCWCFTASFAYIPVTSATVLISTSGSFTLLIGVIFGTEKFTLIKCLVLLGNLGGAVCVLLSDLSNRSLSTFDIIIILRGVILALISATLYSVYSILLKEKMRNKSWRDMNIFFGFIGLFNLVLLWPIFFLFHYTGVETFELPSTWLIWIILVVNALVGVFISNHLYFLAIRMTSALVVTVTDPFGIALILAADIFVKRLQVDELYLIGVALVFFSLMSAKGIKVIDSKKKNK
ncbi:MAG: hypothetical protein DHS80DRAFT_14978 [Piptocephalis tieghemiana]|nr:MAG: hypothetical protein DHS80DRAFT_14978 [Piptocephalis tieghemiana]